MIFSKSSKNKTEHNLGTKKTKDEFCTTAVVTPNNIHSLIKFLTETQRNQFMDIIIH